MSTITQTHPGARTSKRQLMLAVGLGVIAAVLVAIFLSRAGNDSEVLNVPTSRVVVAAEAIEPGRTITGSMITTRDIPQPAAPSDAFGEEALVVGRVARYPIEKDEPLRSARLVDAPEVQSLSFQIPPGKRGMTIPVTMDETPAALIAPGDFVDVIVSVEITVLGFSTPGNAIAGTEERKGAATILQNLQVLAVQRNYADTGVVYEPSTRGKPADGKETISFVTLAVAPEDAQLLWLAKSKGALTLTLRPFGEDSLIPLRPIFEPLGQP